MLINLGHPSVRTRIRTMYTFDRLSTALYLIITLEPLSGFKAITKLGLISYANLDQLITLSKPNLKLKFPSIPTFKANINDSLLHGYKTAK